MKKIIFILALLIFFSYSFALTPIDACQTLNTPGETYILNTSFAGNGNCLIVDAAGIIINGNGSSITGTGTTTPVINSNGAIGYTVGNITIAGSDHAFGIGAASNFSNVVMRDVLLNDTGSGYITMIEGDFPIIANNISLINVTRIQRATSANFGSLIGVIGCQRSGAVTNCSSTLSDMHFSNINLINVSAINTLDRGQTVVGVYSVAAWLNPDQQLILVNSTFQNITFSNATVATSGLATNANTLGVVAVNLDAILIAEDSRVILDNLLIENVNFTSSALTSDDALSQNCYGIIATCDGTSTSNTYVNVTNSNFSLLNNEISSTLISSSGGIIVGDRIFIHNVTIQSVPSTIYLSPSLETPALVDIANVSANISLTSGLSSNLLINTASSNNFTVYNIPSIAADPATAKNTSSYLNFSSQSTNVNFSLFYSTPPAPWLEQDIQTRNLTSGTWSILAAGILDTTTNKMTYNDLSVLTATNTIGLFANDPQFSISLNAPANNIYTNSTSIIFNWTTTGELNRYLSNLSINAVANVTDIPTLNNTLTAQIVNGFADGTYTWGIASYNSSISNTSVTRTFTVDTIPPAITLNSPLNATLTNSTLINFNFTQTDALSPSSNCSIIIDSVLSDNNPTTANATATIFPVSLADGAHNWFISCTDLAGNTNVSETRLITINSVAPNITLQSPTEGQILIPGFVSFTFNATSTLSTTMSCSLLVDSVIVQNNASVQNGTSTQFSENVVAQIAHTWQVQCTDTFSNLAGSEIRNFTTFQSGGGGGGGGAPLPPSGGNTTNTTTTLPEPPLVETPTLNPPPQTPGISSAVDTIVRATNGNVQSIPFSCSPYWQTNFNFIGAKFIDTLACEYKGILSLYFQKLGSFPNLAMIIILFLIIAGSQVKEKTSPVFLSIIGLIVITIVIGVDLLAFSTTAILLRGREFFG